MNKTFMPLLCAPRVNNFSFQGILCLALLMPLLSYGQCVINTNFSNINTYALQSDDCDSNVGTFEYIDGRFTVNDKEGVTCDGSSGNSDNSLRFDQIDISEYINLTLTFDYTIKDESDSGFECTSVFGNGDDMITLEHSVDGNSSGPLHVFCEDTPGNIESQRKAQFAIPNGSTLDVTIYAGTQAPSEFIYFDNFKVCGTKIDLNNLPDPIPDPPAPMNDGKPFYEERTIAECRSNSDDIIPKLESSLYSDFQGGSWIDSEGDAITEIVPSDPKYAIGDNIFYYVLDQGQRSPMKVAILDNNQSSHPVLGPYCESNNDIQLPNKVSGLDGGWDGLGAIINGRGEWEIDLTDLSIGSETGLAFIPESNSTCFLEHTVEIVEQFRDTTLLACPPGLINLIMVFPQLSSIVDEILFEDLEGKDVIDPSNLDVNDFTSSNNEFAFIQNLPEDIGCRGDVSILVDANNCQNTGAAPSAIITIDKINGNICEGDCGEITVDITGGTPPYEIEFYADIPITVPIFNTPLPTIPFPYTSVSGSSYRANICSAPNIGIDDLIFQNDILYDSNTNTWNIPTFITVRGTISGKVRDADGTEVEFDKEIEMQAFDRPDFPIDASDILVCANDISTYGDLSAVDNFDEIIFYDGDPDDGGVEIADFSSVDLLDLYGVWTNPEGCESAPTKIDYTRKLENECTTTVCTDPPMPNFDRGDINQEWCDDGSFQGFRVVDDGFKYDWYDAISDTRLQEGNLFFNPGSGVTGDFYVVAVDETADGPCRSPRLNFSFNFYEPQITVEDCRILDDGMTLNVDVTLNSGDRVKAVEPDAAAVQANGDTYTLLSLQQGTDYQVVITSSFGCESTVELLATSYSCEIDCGFAGDDLTRYLTIDNGTSTSLDLEDLLRNETEIGIFVDGDGNAVSNPYDFTGDVTLYHVIERTGSCDESIAELDLRLTVATINGTICIDSVFCNQVDIELEQGAGPPYSLVFAAFGSKVSSEITFEAEDLLPGNILRISVCVRGDDTFYLPSDKTLVISDDTPPGSIKVEELKDGNGTLLGDVPPLPLDYSDLPIVNVLPTQDICNSEAQPYQILDLDDRILTTDDDRIEWWLDQPSDPNTDESSKVTLNTVTINNRDVVYGLVITEDGCRVEVPVEFTVEDDEKVEVTYKPVYCIGDDITPTIIPNGLDLDFDITPKDGSVINRETGALTGAIEGTEYVINYFSSGKCPATGSSRIKVVSAGDPQCNCGLIDPPVITDADISGSTENLEGLGVSYCQGEDRPPFVIDNPNDYKILWFENETDVTPVYEGNNFESNTRRKNFFVKFVDNDGCESEFTATFLAPQFPKQLSGLPISVCLNEDTSFDLNAYIRNLNQGVDIDGEWIDPNGAVITNPANYDPTGLMSNIEYRLSFNFLDESGCLSENDNIRYIRTSTAEIDLDNFICNSAQNFYSREINAPGFRVLSDVGVVTEASGIFLIDSIPIGTDIDIVISDVFDNCTLMRTLSSPSCDCDGVPTPRLLNDGPICFEEPFMIFNSNNNFEINWYDVPTGGVRIYSGEEFAPTTSGTYYVELIDKASSCVSRRIPVEKLDIIFKPDRADFNLINLTTCSERLDSFEVSNIPPEYEIAWFDQVGNDPLHIGPTFRPDDAETDEEFNYFATYIQEGKCLGTGQELTYYQYKRPTYNPRDTICSEDLKSVSFVFDTRGIVLIPQGTPKNGDGDFVISDISLDQDVIIDIAREQTGVTCEFTRIVNFPTNTCPCPEIIEPQPRGASFETVCSYQTDFEFEVSASDQLDVVAYWFDNESASGEPLLENSLFFTPSDSGAYYVQFIDTITDCASAVTQLNLFYDEVPNAGTGSDMLVCGLTPIDLETLLIPPYDQGGTWRDPEGNQVLQIIEPVDYDFDVPLTFKYIALSNNTVTCTDTSLVTLTLQTPFSAGSEPELIVLCDQADQMIDFDAEIGAHDLGSWLDNDNTGIDLNLDPLMNSNLLDPGEYVFTYVVGADAVCPSIRNDVRINILPLPDVGIDTKDSICSGVEFDYSFASALEGMVDLTGQWQDVDNVLSVNINDNPGQVDLSNLPAGDYTFRFSLASGSCQASSDLDIHVFDNNRAGQDTLVQLCNDGPLMINFETILPDANAYDLSIDGGFAVDFSTPQNVDVSNLPTGAYRVRNIANAVTECLQDESIVELVIEASIVYPSIEENYDVCYGDTVDLSQVVATGGIFEELIPAGALVGDTLYTSRLPIDIPQPISYLIPTDSVCVPEPVFFTVTGVSPPNAGDDVSGTVCQGDSIDLMTLLPANADLGGVFGDIEGTGALIGSVLFTDALSESIVSFSYLVGDGIICPQDLSVFNIDIREKPSLPDTLEFIICEDEGVDYDLTTVLDQIDNTGEWINSSGLSIDLSNPQSVDLSSLETLTTYTLEYALSNGMCADTVVMTFEIDETVNPGQDGVFRGHCAGEQEIINLYDLLDDEDQGIWFDADNNQIQDATNFDLGILVAGNFTFKHLVQNTNLEYCNDDSVTVQILVESAPNAGMNDTITLCQNVDFDLLTLVSDQTDASGMVVDGDNHGNLVGSVINTGPLAAGTYDYYYVLATNASCDPDTAIFTAIIVTDINAGDTNSAVICQGDLFDLESLVLNGDSGGRFENADTQTTFADNLLVTDALSGIQNIRYIVESGSCDSDTASYTLDIRVIPDLGESISFGICQSEATGVDLLSRLGASRDQTGTWLDTHNLGLNLSDLTNVDLSGISPLGSDTLKYTVSNANCADTIDVVFAIDQALFAGEAGIMRDHCQGRPGTINLYDLFTNVDLGSWTLDGVVVDDPLSFDLSVVPAGLHTLEHTVINANLGICSDVSQTVSLEVYPAVTAGEDVETTLCQNITFDIQTLLDDDADLNGVFVDENNVGNLTGSQISTVDIAEGLYEYYYIVSASANCEPDSALISVNVVTVIDAGQDNGDEECQGTDYDLTDLVLDGDLGGTFINVSTGASYDDVIINTDNIVGDQVIIYIVESPSCQSDTAEYLLTINPSYDLVEEFNIAQGDSIMVDGIWRFAAETIVTPGSTDANCDSTITTIITVSDFKVEVTGVSCNEFADGIISVDVTAGVAPFNIMYTQVDGNLDGETSLLRPGEIDYDLLPQGTYRVMISDATGEVLYNEEVIIGVNNQIIPTIESIGVSCFGFTDGSLAVTEILIDGVAQSLDDYGFSWSSGDLTSSTGKLGGGFHQVVITDMATMCPFEFEYFVEEPEALLVDTIISDFQCGGTKGSIELDLLSNVDDLPEFSINGGPLQGVGLFTDLDAGFYSVTIAYGDCSQEFENLEVKEASDNIIEIEPNDITLVVGQEEQINVLINFQSINAEWSTDIGLDTTDQLNPLLTAVETTDYILTVTDGFGCTVTDTLKVEVVEWQDPIPDIFIPNIFNPLSTNGNDRFIPLVEENYPGTFEMRVFNRWGNIVHERIDNVYDANTGWDGRHNGELVKIGVYTYMIEFNFDNGTYLKRSGDLTVIY